MPVGSTQAVPSVPPRNQWPYDKDDDIFNSTQNKDLFLPLSPEQGYVYHPPPLPSSYKTLLLQYHSNLLFSRGENFADFSSEFGKQPSGEVFGAPSSLTTESYSSARGDTNPVMIPVVNEASVNPIPQHHYSVRYVSLYIPCSLNIHACQNFNCYVMKALSCWKFCGDHKCWLYGWPCLILQWPYCFVFYQCKININ